MRPDWNKKKYFDPRIDLSNNLTYDSILNTQIQNLLRSSQFDCRQYTDEYYLYKILEKYLSISSKHISIGFGIGEIIQRFYTAKSKWAIVSPTWSMPEIFSNIKNIEYCLIDKPKKVKDCNILYIATPNNITGQITDEDIILNAAKYYDIVIVDEAYYDWTSVDSLYDKHKNIVVLRTLSKSLGQAGFRFAYALGSKQIIEFLQLNRPSSCSHSFMIPILKPLLDFIPEHLVRMHKTKGWIEHNFDCKSTYANFVIFNKTPSNLEIYKTKNNRMSLCDLELAKCLVN